MYREIQPRKLGISFVLQEFPVAMGARMVGVGNRLLETALARGANNDFREVPSSEVFGLKHQQKGGSMGFSHPTKKNAGLTMFNMI